MSITEPGIAILLSTFNGERYLAAQLDSLLAQTYPNFLLLVRDDNSSDGTREILQDYQNRHPQRVHLLREPGVKLGACQSFMRLIDYALAEKTRLGLSTAYMAFCDQDDVWHADKLSLSMNLLASHEQGGTIPVLVHTDLRVVDAELKEIAPSLAQFQGLVPRASNLGRTLVANAVTGCTVLINELLARQAMPAEPAAVMHDWWLALVARLQGEIVFLDRSTVDYRQHGANTLGARQQLIVKRNLIDRALDDNTVDLLAQVAGQATRFRQRFAQALTLRQKLVCRLAGLMVIRISLLQKLLYRIVRRC